MVGACVGGVDEADGAATMLVDTDWAQTAAIAVRDDAGGLAMGENDTAPIRGGSTAKLFTAAAALTTLGPDVPLTTELMSVSPSQLVLEGGWDALLTVDDLERLAVQAAENGRLGRDGVEVTVSPGSDSTRLIARPPDWPDDLAAMIEPAPLMARGNTMVLRGKAVVDRLVDELQASGVSAVASDVAASGRGAPRRVASVAHTVDEAVMAMLSDSDSLIAEALYRLMGSEHSQEHDWRAIGQQVEAVLQGAGVDVRGLSIVDGSGTSGQNRLTTRAVSDILVHALDRAEWSAIAEGLPLAGQTGTLSSEAGRFDSGPEACAAGRVRAKTGTLADVAGLSGYAETDDGVRVFSFILNGIRPGVTDETRKSALDRAAAGLVGCLPPS